MKSGTDDPTILFLRSLPEPEDALIAAMEAAEDESEDE